MSAQVLIVEDEERSRKLARDIVASLGFATTEAESAERALEMVCERVPALVLMDIRLPGIDGIEALRRLRLDPRTQAVPVIAVTASVMPDQKARLLAAGFSGFVGKPYHFNELVAAVIAILGEPE